MAKHRTSKDDPEARPDLAASATREEPSDEACERYQVGYKKPPREHRFKKGQSGNPKGGKKRRKTAEEQFWEELKRPVAVKENGDAVMLSPGAFGARALRAAVARKEPAALKLYLELLRQLGAQEAQQQSDFNPENAQAILDAYVARQNRGGPNE